MEYNFRDRVEYSENVAPKYVNKSHEGLEVVPNESPLYALPPAPLPTVGNEKWAANQRDWAWTDTPTSAAVTAPGGVPHKEERRRILGLTVPIFWAVIILIVVILAAAIGGGVGGALSARNRSDTTNTPQSSATTAPGPEGTPSPTTSQDGDATAVANAALPSDGGCPQIENQTHTPYTVDGKAIPLEQGLQPQQFVQHCYTRFAEDAQTHDILKIFMPTLENCMMTCAAYNAAYRKNLNANTGVGGGYCVSVTLEKVNAGFCYLKNGTGTNDTSSRSGRYSSAVLLTNLDETVS